MDFEAKMRREIWVNRAWRAVGLLLVTGFGFWGVMLLRGAVLTSYKLRQGTPENAVAGAGGSPAGSTETNGSEAAPAVAVVPTGGSPSGPAGVEPAEVAAGQKVYSMVCIACHQPNGKGMPNLFPPLDGSDWVQAPKPDRLIRVVLHGLMGPITVSGVPFAAPAAMMPPQGGALNDKQIAEVLTYIRATWGGQKRPVSEAEVASIRKAEAARTAMWTEAELSQIPVQ